MKMKLLRPQIEAKKILDNMGWSAPGDLLIEEIALASNAFVKEADLDGSEGRILMNGNDAIITVDSKIDYQPKRNFVIAHEIGHFVLHKDLTPIYSDTDKTLSQWYSKGKQEQEANLFASELLMPSDLFVQKVKGEKICLGLIESIANYFQTSLTSTLLKYKDYGDYPMSVIFVENAKVAWKAESEDFPLKYLPKNSLVREGSVVFDFFQGGSLEDNPTKVEAIDWFPEDFNIEEYEDLELYEQNFRVGEKGVLCFLWLA